MINIQKLQEERTKLYTDFYNNIIPKRLPVALAVTPNILAEYGGVDIIEAQYNYGILEPAARKICDVLYGDACPVWLLGIISRIPSYYQILESQSFIMGKSGYIQHPEVVGMLAEDYDYLIEDPLACIFERVLPRQYKSLSLDNPVNAYMSLMKSTYAIENDTSAFNAFLMKIIEEKGYYPGAPKGSVSATVAPYDFLADQLRSFSGMSSDIRRDRKKVAEACEAVFPLMLKWGLPFNPNPAGKVSCPLHMPTFMREKDFAEIWLPTFLTMTQQYAAYGARQYIFCEDDWMRYLDYLMEFPAGTIMRFEYGDMQKIKDKLGKKYIIQGMYPIEVVKNGTKQQVIDKAKELLDIMMPGAGYIFDFDKNPLMGSDINMDNYIALAEYLRDNAVYDNAGESYGVALNSEGYTFDPSLCEFKSKYKFDWKSFKDKYPLTPDFAKVNFEKYEDRLQNSLLTLLM